MKNKKISKSKKIKIYGGALSRTLSDNSWWNNSVGFGIIGSTIVSVIQLIFTIVNSFVSKGDQNNKSNYNPSYLPTSIKYRISKYPSKSSVFI